MEINKNIVIILLCFWGSISPKSYSKSLDNVYLYTDSTFYPGLEQYLDVYFDFCYNYPKDLSELLLFIDYYNDSQITLDSYCGYDLLNTTLPKIKKYQGRIFTYRTDSCFSIWLDNEILVVSISPRSGTPCKYLQLIESGFDDRISTVYQYNVLFFDRNMKPVIRGLDTLTSSFYKLKMELLEEYSNCLHPVLGGNGGIKKQFYQYEESTGLTFLCEESDKYLINDFYNDFSNRLQDYCYQYNLSKIIFNMGIYSLE